MDRFDKKIYAFFVDEGLIKPSQNDLKIMKLRHKWVLDPGCKNKDQFDAKVWRCDCGATKLFKGIGQSPLYWDKTGDIWYTKVPPCGIG